MFHTVVQQGF